MTYAVTALLIYSVQIKPWHVCVTGFLMAVAQTFQQPARVALVSDAVPAGSLTNAIGLQAMVFNVARSTGPALAGMLIVLIGTGGAYYGQAIFYLLATFLTVRLRTERSSATGEEAQAVQRESFAQSIPTPLPRFAAASWQYFT